MIKFSAEMEAIAFTQATRAMDMYVEAKKKCTEARDQANAARAARLVEQQTLEDERQKVIDDQERLVASRRAEVNFGSDPAKMNGVIAKFATGCADQQNEIRSNVDRLLRRHIEDDDKIDFAGLPFDGRVMFLPAYLGLMVGKDYPRFDFERADPKANTYVYVTRYGPADAKPWNDNLIRINRYLGGSWRATELDGTSIKIWRLPDLPDVIPMSDSLFRRGEIFFGIDMATGAPYYVPLTKMTHLLVGGQSGVGKSVMLNQCLRSMLFNLDLIDELILVDLKRVELSRYDGLSPKITVVRTYEELPALVERVLAKMYRRLEELEKTNELTVKSGFTVLIIDEYASIEQQVVNGKEETAAKKALTAKLVKLSQLGRAAGIRLWAQLQKPTGDNMDSSFRTNLQSVACFFMPVKINASAMFGDLEGLPADPTNLGRGEFILQDDGQNRTVHLKAAMCDEHDIDGLKACVHPDHRPPGLPSGGMG